MRSKLVACLVASIVSSSCLHAAYMAGPLAVPNRKSSFDSNEALPNSRIEFRFDPGEHPLFLPVRFGPQVYDFMLDTGASGTIFDLAFRARLGEPVGTTGGTAANDRIVLQLFAAPHAFVGPFDIADCNRVACIDLQGLAPILGRDVHGIVGMDILKRHVLQIDFDAGRIAFLDGATVQRQDWGQDVPMSCNSLGMPQVKAAVRGSPELDFVVDTGYGGGGSLERSLFDEFVSSGHLKVNENLAATAAGVTKLREVRVDRLTVGPFEYQGLIFDDAGGNVLGADLLSRHTVTFDFPNGRLYLKKGKDFTKPAETDMSGLNLTRSEGRTLVYAVRDGRPAAMAGIKTGDIVLKLQGRDVNAYRMWQIGELLQSGDGKEITMTLRRGGDTIDVSLRLERAI